MRWVYRSILTSLTYQAYLKNVSLITRSAPMPEGTSPKNKLIDSNASFPSAHKSLNARSAPLQKKIKEKGVKVLGGKTGKNNPPTCAYNKFKNAAPFVVFI